ncbi:MAG: SDR family oxidoreductase [Thermoguttaceae bacterium]|nr:SDR family oxidoreductase [Thermoguttaceae bacterium]
MVKRNLRGARALVTGASSGIGRELVLELARRGCSTLSLARTEEELRKLVDEANEIRARAFPDSPEHFYIVGDVCSSDVREQAVADAVERFEGLDLLVNNAGAGATLLVEETSDELACELFDLNFFSPLELTKTALPALKESASKGRRPLVVNVASIVGVRGTPYYGVYGASKAALIALTDAWRAELCASGVDFLTVAPGTTATRFFHSLREDKGRPNLPKHAPADPKAVAVEIASAAERGAKRIVPASKSAKALGFFSRHFPALIDDLMKNCASETKASR